MVQVEDEWERDLQADEDLDLLFVTYEESRISLETVFDTIREHGFEPEVRE